MELGLIHAYELAIATESKGANQIHKVVSASDVARGVHNAIDWLESIRQGTSKYKRIALLNNKSFWTFKSIGIPEYQVHSNNLICELLTNNTRCINGDMRVGDKILSVNSDLPSLYIAQNAVVCNKCRKRVLSSTYFMHDVIDCTSQPVHGSTYDVPDWYDKAVDIYDDTMSDSMSFIEYMKAIITNE